MTQAAIELLSARRGTIDYLGPATVLAARTTDVDVALPGGRRVRAEIALAQPYEAAVGDVLLVISGRGEGDDALVEGGGAYVLGVLRGRGRSVVELPGDVELRAVGGTLRLHGDRGVAIEGPQLEVRVDKVQVFADSVLRTARTVVEKVSELWTLHAGEAHRITEGADVTQAGSATLLTEDKVCINGKEIHLG